MCLNEIYSRVREGKNLSDIFPIKNGLKQGDVLFNVAIEHVIRTVQVNQDGLKLHDTHQLLGYVYDVNVLGGSVHTRVVTLIVATIYLQLIQNRYIFRSFTVLQCSHQHCVQPVASDVEVVGYL